MPNRYLPDYDVVLNFPEGTSDIDMTGYIQDKYPRKSPLRIGELNLDPQPFIDLLFRPETNQNMQEYDKVAAPQFTKPQGWNQREETDFKEWYGNWSEETGLNPDPDDPQHYYDYRAAFRAGASPTPNARGEYHWPSEFKHPDHPNRFVEGIDTITGKPMEAVKPKELSTGLVTFRDMEQLNDYVNERERGAGKTEYKPEGWVGQRIKAYTDYLTGLNEEDRARRATEALDQDTPHRITNFVTRLGNDFIAGALGVGTGLVASLDWLLESETMHELSKLGTEFTKRFTPEDATWFDQLVMGAGSMATFFIPGFGVMGVTGRLMKGGQMARQLAKLTGLSVATIFESMTEAGHSFKDILDATGDRAKAEKTAKVSFLLNTALIGITNKLGIFGDQGRLARRAVASFLMEGSQEGGQEIIAALAEGRSVDWKDVGVSASIGAVLGPLVGLGAAGMERLIPGAKEKRIEAEKMEEGAKKYEKAMKEQRPEEAKRILKEMGAVISEAPVAKEVPTVKGAPMREEAPPTAPFTTKRAAAEWGLAATSETIEAVRDEHEDVLEEAKLMRETGQTEEAMKLLSRASVLREAIDAFEQPERFQAMLKTTVAKKAMPKEELAKPQLPLFKIKKKVPTITPVAEAGEKAMTPKRFAEHTEKLQKAGVQVGKGPFNKGFFVSAGVKTGTIYGPALKSDEVKTRVVKKLFGYKEVTEHFRTIDGIKYKVLNTPILPKTKKSRAQAIDNLVKKFAHESLWYENWSSFMGQWEGAVPEAEVLKAKKIQAVLSRSASPQGAQTITGRIIKRLETSGSIKGGEGKSISKFDAPKINMVWKGEDTHIKSLEDHQDFYGMKIGAMMYAMLHPKTEAEAVVIDRHIPRLWGHNVMWGRFNVTPALRREIVDDIVDASRRLDIPIPGIQAALWFATGAGHTGTATHFEEAIQAAPKKSLGLAMFTALTIEPQSVVHFGRELRYMIRGPKAPTALNATEKKELTELRLKSKETRLFGNPLTDEQSKRLTELVVKEEGEKPNPWSKNSVLKRMENHTPLNPYIPLGHWYPAYQRRESFFEGQEPHLTTIYEDEIYDLDEDKLGYWNIAKKRAASDPMVKENKRVFSDILINAITNVIYEAGGKDKDFKGFKLRTGSMDVVYTFDETPVEEYPLEMTVGISDMVNSAVELPTDLEEVMVQSSSLAQNFKTWIQNFLKGQHVSIGAIQPTLSNAGDATQHNIEYGLQLSLRGPETAIKALTSQLGLARSQQGVLLMNSEKAHNGVNIEFDFKDSDIAKVSRAIRRSGLQQFNIVRTGAGFRFSYFLSYAEAENESLRDKIDTLYKGFGREGTLTEEPTHAEFVGDFVESPDVTLANYKENIIKYFGKTKGEQIYEESKLQGDRWASEYAQYFESVVRQQGIKEEGEPEEYRDRAPVRHPEEKNLFDASESDITFEDNAEQKTRERGKQYSSQWEWKDPKETPDWVKNEPVGLDLPELVLLAEQLCNGKLPKIAKIIGKDLKTRGLFTPGKERPITTKAEIFSDPVQAKKTISHEIAHLVDWLPDAMTRGNILGHIATLKRYMRKTLPHHPGAKGELTEQDRRRLRLEAAKLLKAANRVKLIDEMITKEMPITSQDVMNVWNAVVDMRLMSPELYNYIAQLGTNAKKLIIKAAMKGQVPAELQQFAKKISTPTGRKIEVLEEITPEKIAEKYRKLIEKEILKRKLWVEQEIRDELRRHSQSWRPFDPAADPKYTTYRAQPDELYADALSALLVDPQYLRRNCPKFYEAFFSWMEAKPEVMAVYNSIQWMIHSGTVDQERTISTYKMFDDGNEKYGKELYEAIPNRTVWDDLKRDTFDTYHYILKDIKKIGEKEIPSQENPRYAIENMVYSGSEIEGLVTTLSHNVVKPLKEANLEWDREFGLLAFLQRVVVERAALANPRGWDAKTALKKIKAMQQKELSPVQWMKLQEALDNFRKIHKEYFLNNAEAAQIYPDDLMKKMQDNEFYVTFGVQDFFGQRYGRAAGMRIHQQIGTLNNIFNPATATMLRDVSFIKSVNRNRAIRSVVEFYMKNQHLLPNVKIEPCTKKNRGLQWNGKFMEIQESKDPSQGLLVYLHKGKAHGFYVNKEIADAFETNPVGAWGVSRVLAMLAKPFRMVFTELNYGFWLFNAFFRDLQRAMMSLPKGATPAFLKSYIQGIKPAFRSVFGIPDDVVKEMQDGNMLISIADMRGLLDEDKQVERLLKMYNMAPGKFETKIAGPFGQLFNYIGNVAKTGEYYFSGVGKALERTTKVASYKYLKDHFPDMPQEVVAHIVRERGGSPDFLRTGRAHSIYNNVLLFSNAMKEGYRGDILAMKDNPAGWWTKKFTFMLLPKVLMLGALYGLLGDDIREIMEGATDYDLTNYLIIPLGLSSSGKSVYFRVPTDETSRLVGGIVWKMLQLKETGIPDGLDALGDYMAGQAPTTNPAFSTVADIVAYASGENPYDNFYGRHAVPEQVFLAHDARAHKAFLKYLAGKLGASIIYKFKYDDVDQIAEELESVLGFPIKSKIGDWMIRLPDEPVASNALGRFLKVTNYGRKEKLRKGRQKIQRKNAQIILDAKEAARMLVNGEPLTPKHIQALALKPDVVDRNVLVGFARRHSWVYLEEYMAARTKEEKWYVVSQMVAENAMSPATIAPPGTGGLVPAPSGEVPTEYFKFEE